MDSLCWDSGRYGWHSKVTPALVSSLSFRLRAGVCSSVDEVKIWDIMARHAEPANSVPSRVHSRSAREQRLETREDNMGSGDSH